MAVKSPAQKIAKRLLVEKKRLREAIKDFFRASPEGLYLLQNPIQGVNEVSWDTLEEIKGIDNQGGEITIYTEDDGESGTQTPIGEWQGIETLLAILMELEAKYYYEP